jgi:hypothetical protein
MARRLVPIGAAVFAVTATVLVTAAPAGAAAATFTVVDHGTSFTQSFPDDICGERASTTTFTRTVEQTHLTTRSDGTFAYHDVTVFTYTSDYVDPSLPDVSGRGTEVNNFVLTPGGTFIVSLPFHDFFGDVRIHVKVHLTLLADGTVAVEREVLDVTGCP